MSVNIGAFWFLDYNEDKLAAVIAHELVHGQKEHPIKGAKKKMSVDFVMKTVGSEIGGANGLAAQVVAVHAKNTGVTKPNEWEADNIAFTYMADAGYNVGAPAAVWQAVIESSSDSSKKMFSATYSTRLLIRKTATAAIIIPKSLPNTATARLLLTLTAAK